MSFTGTPAQYAAVVIPSDGTPLQSPARSLYIGVAGNVRVLTVGGSDVILNNVPVGILPIQVSKVFNSNTTASSIVAMW